MDPLVQSESRLNKAAAELRMQMQTDAFDPKSAVDL